MAGRRKGTPNSRHYRTCKICGERFLVIVTPTDKKLHVTCCPKCEDIEQYQDEAIAAAEDLGYPAECAERIQKAKTTNEIARIMHTYRDRLYGYN